MAIKVNGGICQLIKNQNFLIQELHRRDADNSQTKILENGQGIGILTIIPLGEQLYPIYREG